MGQYMIQIDEETGGDETWDELHTYARNNPPPECLLVYTDRLACWPVATVVGADQASAANAWLARCAIACGWDEHITPILVIPCEASS